MHTSVLLALGLLKKCPASR